MYFIGGEGTMGLVMTCGSFISLHSPVIRQRDERRDSGSSSGLISTLTAALSLLCWVRGEMASPHTVLYTTRYSQSSRSHGGFLVCKMQISAFEQMTSVVFPLLRTVSIMQTALSCIHTEMSSLNVFTNMNNNANGSVCFDFSDLDNLHHKVHFRCRVYLNECSLCALKVETMYLLKSKPGCFVLRQHQTLMNLGSFLSRHIKSWVLEPAVTLRYLLFKDVQL